MSAYPLLTGVARGRGGLEPFENEHLVVWQELGELRHPGHEDAPLHRRVLRRRMRRVAVGTDELVVELRCPPDWFETVDDRVGGEVAVNLDRGPTIVGRAGKGMSGGRCVELPDLDAFRRGVERPRGGRIAAHPQPGGDVCRASLGAGDHYGCRDAPR